MLIGDINDNDNNSNSNKNNKNNNNSRTTLVRKDIWEIHKFKACFCAPFLWPQGK